MLLCIYKERKLKLKDRTREHAKKQTTEMSLSRREMEINAVVRKRGSGKINERGMRRGRGGEGAKGEQAKDEKTEKGDRSGDVLGGET